MKKLTVTKATALTQIASIYLRRHEFEHALRYINQSIYILERFHGPASARASAFKVKSKVLRKLGQKDESEEFEKRADEVMNQVQKAP